MNAGGLDRAGSVWANVAAGKASTFLISRFSPWLVLFIHCTNCAAWAGCLELAVTTSASPPQVPTAWSPAVHAGSAAACHLPAVLGAIVGSWFGAHWAETQPTIVPLFMSVFHWVEKLGSGLMTPLL